ncbi:MAG: pectate lyase [Prolixibacteraceae bacterium]
MIFNVGNKVLAVHVILFYSILQVESQPIAFPSAEGFGKYATGGRGGKVIYVTNLNDDSNAGSLRYAVNQAYPRNILFKVSGTIQLKSNLNITKGDVTIAGQTAPGEGICLRDYSVTVDAANVIIRYMRFRMGDEAKQQNDCFWGRDHGKIIIDHCSMSWSTDECSSFYDNSNFTMQWCLLAESLRISVHDKGSHGYGGIWGGQNASFHHNLLADHDSRNPRFCGSRYTNKPDLEYVDFQNNVIYNWGGNSSYAGEGGKYNMVNNYYKAGPATSSSSKSRIMQPYPDDGTNSQPVGVYGTFYVSGNFMTSSAAVTNDNWQGISLASVFTTLAPGVTISNLRSDKIFPASDITSHLAQTAYLKVLDYAGASLVRDTVDRRVIHDVRTGTATFPNGGNGSTNGLIDTQSAVGGWPVLNSAAAPVDTDNDGMPDSWEIQKSLDPKNASDGQLFTIDSKFTNVEVYINNLVAAITDNQNKDAIYTGISVQINPAGNQQRFSMRKENGFLKVSDKEIIKAVQIYSLTGQLLLTKTCNTNEIEVSLASIHSNILIVRVLYKSGNFNSQKFNNF